MIEGTSSSHGETELAMSESLQIATLELLRQDGSLLATSCAAITKDAKSKEADAPEGNAT
ncbi:hypothetical protein WK69_25015 [Burkholderia ubonensis]|nr:hypothetical protein WJ72_08630 [Burkholderia ubonensis]KVU39682.1 hypothetical protein WK69_25015 [Burkholderia ubonensis]